MANSVSLTTRSPPSATWSTSASEPITKPCRRSRARPARTAARRPRSRPPPATPGSRAARACARSPRARARVVGQERDPLPASRSAATASTRAGWARRRPRGSRRGRAAGGRSGDDAGRAARRRIILARHARPAAARSCCSPCVVLAACGCDDDDSTTTPRRRHATPADHGGRRSGCEKVAEPEPKGGGKLAKPKLKLDPAKTYVAKVTTNCGDFEITLDAKRAPKTGGSFVYLAGRASTTAWRSTGSSPAS